MCACKETDVREWPNDSTLSGGEGQSGRGETCHPQYRESPISSVIEILYFCMSPMWNMDLLESVGENFNASFVMKEFPAD
jgi:hypothetical protein